MQTILIAGGTGLIGTRLAQMLREKGHTVRLLTRTPKAKEQYAWDPARGIIEMSALKGVDTVINLAGAGIADKRWSPERKKLLINSRVQSARTLRDAFQNMDQMPKVYLSAAAIGYYGNSGENLMYEGDPPVDQSFMVECCTAWELAAEEIGALGIRTVTFRIGVVLAKEGGALAEFIRPLRFGIGAYFADGKAWYSWIHRDDVCRAFIWALEKPQIEGVFNVVAPRPERIKALVKAIARAMHQPALIVPAPAFAMRLWFGEMSAVILNSNKVSDEKIRAAGFHCRFGELGEALEEIFRK